MASDKSSHLSLEERTRGFYEHNAEDYVQKTFDLNVAPLYDRFIPLLPPRARILDAGSGSGRDTLEFLRSGYDVSAFDSSPALCALSTKLTGVVTHELRFQDLKDNEEYDGIWACASLLHVPQSDLSNSILRLVHALKPGGVLYMSFKHGLGQRISEDGRFFNDMTPDGLKRLLQEIPEGRIQDIWTTVGEGNFQGITAWVNALFCKTSDAN